MLLRIFSASKLIVETREKISIPKKIKKKAQDLPKIIPNNQRFLVLVLLVDEDGERAKRERVRQ